LETLAAGSGVSRSTLSQIERGRANPTLAVTLSIARAFNLTIGEFLEVEGAPAPLQVIRRDDAAYHYRADEHCRLRTLSPLHLEKEVEFHELTLAASGALRSAPHYEGTREFLTVRKGAAKVESAGAEAVLRAGDSVNYRADCPHAIVNAGKGEMVAFLVVVYARPA
jgi:transcriptional regulator with XRE-family HTH domain